MNDWITRRQILRALRQGDEDQAMVIVRDKFPLAYLKFRNQRDPAARRVHLAAICATSVWGRRKDIVRLNREMRFCRRGSAPGGFCCVVDLAHSARDGDWGRAGRRIGQVIEHDGREIRESYLRNLLRAIAFPPAPDDDRGEIQWKMRVMAMATRE